MLNTDFENLKSFILDKKYSRLKDDDFVIDFDKDALGALSQIFLFLSLVFRYPSNEVYNTLSENLENFNDLFDEYLDKRPELPSHDDIEPEYVSLFIAKKGGAPAPLYASVYTDDEKLLLRDSTVRLKRIMAECGFEINESLDEIEDNLYIILEFVYAVLQNIINGELNQKELADKFYCVFVAVYEYLNEFVAEFSSKVQEFANFEYYNLMSVLLKEFINEFDDILEEILEIKNI